LMIEGQIDKIILSRPAVEAGENLGFLPGDLKEKIDPYLRPLYDALYEMLPKDVVDKKLELGEIEANVNLLPGIKLSGCVYDDANQKIVLYFVGDMEAAELTKTLRDKLPRYMLPNKIKKLESMPFTANGKINRKLLKQWVVEGK